MVNDYAEVAARLEKALLVVDRIEAESVFSESGVPTFELIENVIAPTLERIGTLWINGTASLSQVYMSGRICEELMNSVLPHDSEARISQPRTAIAVLEDYHSLGKRVVTSVLRANGYRIDDYGSGISVEALAAKVVEDRTEILLISTLMLPSALRISDLRFQLRKLGANTRLIVGGAPFRFDTQLWQEVGADAVGISATEALQVVTRMMEELS